MSDEFLNTLAAKRLLVKFKCTFVSSSVPTPFQDKRVDVLPTPKEGVDPLLFNVPFTSVSGVDGWPVVNHQRGKCTEDVGDRSCCMSEE